MTSRPASASPLFSIGSVASIFSASSVKKLFVASILPIAIVLIWQFSGNNGSLFGGVLPTPDRVASAWYTWAFGSRGMGLNPYSGTWFDSLVFSTTRVLQGFAVAVIVGIPTGILIGWTRMAAHGIDPTIQLLRPIPITAWLPFSIAVFGISSLGAIFLIALGVFYPVVINTTQGARHVERNLVRAAQMMGASRFDILWRVVVPASLPAIFTGLRIGLGIGWTAVIVAEMIAVKSGLGYVLWDAYYVGRMDVVIADMATIGLMGLISDQLILMVERYALAWRYVNANR
ncbi:ABC transporter permease [Rhodobacterales bacterium]|nr:ABC transporter permease [Rhodobacterales bacterium]